MRWLALIVLGLAFGAGPAVAHEIRPAYLEIREDAPGLLEVRFRQPIVDAGNGLVGGLNLAPLFPDGCSTSDAIPMASADNYLTLRQKVSCPSGLNEVSVTIGGLERTLTDVYVTHVRADGTRLNHLLNARSPGLTLGEAGNPAAFGYFRVGVNHLLGGIDHVLFVIGLVLLVPGVRALITSATMFTLAHSLTLALSVLGLVRLPSAPVEAGIALSVVYLAYELTRRDEGARSQAQLRPGRVAFGFGLLHGFGFAGALAQTGMPSGQLAPALLMFNLGVEAGQLLIILVIITAFLALRQLGEDLVQASRMAFSCVLAVGAAYFFVDAFSNLLSV